MKTREIPCEYYICKGQCAKGRNAEFYGICQHCKYFKPRSGSKPVRTDNRKKKLNKILNKEYKSGIIDGY